MRNPQSLFSFVRIAPRIPVFPDSSIHVHSCNWRTPTRVRRRARDYTQASQIPLAAVLERGRQPTAMPGCFDASLRDGKSSSLFRRVLDTRADDRRRAWKNQWNTDELVRAPVGVTTRAGTYLWPRRWGRPKFRTEKACARRSISPKWVTAASQTASVLSTSAGCAKCRPRQRTVLPRRHFDEIGPRGSPFVSCTRSL